MLINKIKIKKVAYPKEHGSWGFLLEPLLLASLIAFTIDGLFLSISTFVIFLAHQPARILLNIHFTKDLKLYAFSFFLFYFLIVITLLFFLIIDVNFNSLIPFGIASFIMLIYLILESKNLARNLIVEFIAPISLTLIAINIVLLDNWESMNIFAFGIVLLSRAIPTVLYVNVKIKIGKGQRTNYFLLRIFELFFLALISIFAINNYNPYLAIVAMLLLIFRSFVGLLDKNKNEKVKSLGIKEFLFGFLFVIINAIGYLLDL